ncbi:hypothetical protein QPK87_10145 [Kamptonema cortianum]|nr:hypothetical protein [Geitlerinema splendidum]MDK3156937.1 hypothetical protein [Kamptonema cortianum]
MARVSMRRNGRQGGSLIELLTVIVVFLIGILSVAKVFAPGLGILRTTRNNTQANALARSAVQQILGQSSQLAEYVSPARIFLSGGVVNVVLDPTVDPNELNPPIDSSSGNGNLDPNGRVIDNGNDLGYWTQVSGSNRFNRIIGEGRPVPQPTTIAGQFVSPLQLMFAPIIHVYDSGTDTTNGNLLQVYGNDLQARRGDTDNLIPAANELNYETYSFTTVTANQSININNTPFPATDQIWIGRLQNPATNTLLSHGYRITMSFALDTGMGVRQVENVFTVQPGDPAYADNTTSASAGNYAVISLPELLNPVFGSANYRGVEMSSIRVQRLYQEIPMAVAFDPNDPYQFKAANRALGMLWVNPVGAGVKVTDIDGVGRALLVRADYSVYDWRILRDEFRVPRDLSAGGYNAPVKLVMSSLMTRNGIGPDGRTFGGLSAPGDTSVFSADSGGTVANQDFILVDTQTGAIVGGNDGSATSAYTVDKSTGHIRFFDIDTSDSLAITGRLWHPGNTPADPWVNIGTVDLSGRKVRALYVARGEYAVQMYKAASQYRIVSPSNPTLLSAGQVYVGASMGWGQPNRLYFPLADAGQKVTVGESWVTGPLGPVLRDRDFRIAGRESIGGAIFSYAELPIGHAFDASLTDLDAGDPVDTGYAVRRVQGASIKVRALWNPEFFNLTGNNQENFNRLVRWAQSWKRVETETFDAGANN